MQSFRAALPNILSCLVLIAGLAMATMSSASARTEALLLVEADSGKVLEAENATFPWYPASLTKLMTAYVTLKAVKDGRITLNTLYTVSPNAAAQSPSKMGFPPGTQVTVDNALKMLMVKSANDMAVLLAEGVGGSVDGFADMMNATARRLGMTQTRYVNPNGLPDDRQVTSARDMAILARAIIRDLPEYEYFVHVPAIRYGHRVIANFNKLIGRFPGADGMKTGFICSSGFNLVASATQNGRRLIAVVLGAPSSRARSIEAIKLLDRGFSSGNLTWLKPALGTVDHLAPIDAAPPDLRAEVCGPKRKRPASDDPGEETVAGVAGSNPALAFFSSGLKPPTLRPEDMLAAAAAPAEPVPVYTGPARTGADVLAAVEADAARQASHARKSRAARHGNKRSRTAKSTSQGQVSVTIETRKSGSKSTAKHAEKPKPAPKTESKSEAKHSETKHPETKHSAAKPTAAKRSASADSKPAAKPKSTGTAHR